MKKTILPLISFLGSFSTLFCQQRTIGLTVYDNNHRKGYHLLSPMVSGATKSYLIDDCGRVVKSWTGSGMPGTACILGHDGSLIRTKNIVNNFMALGNGGQIEKYDWNDNLIWSFKLSDSNENLHHDIYEIPNGNILALVWERHSADEAEVLGRTFPLGRTDILSERIIEIQPIDKDSFEIVWQWRLWDHMVQNTSSSMPSYGEASDHPELMDINFYEASDIGRDWWHLNGISYNEELDQIIITSRSLGEMYVIDHSTNMLQAAGHSGGRWGKGGDILYRWGNPAAYGRGLKKDQRLFVPHHAHWIPNGYPNGGKILVFNNGDGRPQGNYSTVEMIDPAMNMSKEYILNTGEPYGPVASVVKYEAPRPTDFYAPVVSGSYMLKNGHLYTTWGTKGKVFETDSTGKIVWQYINPFCNTGLQNQGSTPGINTVFRYEFYEPDFSGFQGKNLSPGKELELNPNPSRLCDLAYISDYKPQPRYIYPNPAKNIVHVKGTTGEARIYDLAGRLKTIGDSSSISLEGIDPGVYLVETGVGNEKHRDKLIVN
jgi:hypothetical protein